MTRKVQAVATQKACDEPSAIIDLSETGGPSCNSWRAFSKRYWRSTWPSHMSNTRFQIRPPVTSARMAVISATLRAGTGASSIPDGQRRHVIALDGAGGERLDGGDQRVQQHRRTAVVVRRDRGGDTGVDEFSAAHAQRFRHAVAEDDDPIAGFELHGLFVERNTFEQPERRPA